MRKFKDPLKGIKPRRRYPLATLIVRAPLRTLAIIGLTTLVLAGFVVRAYKRPTSPVSAALGTGDPRVKLAPSVPEAATTSPNIASAPANAPPPTAVGAYRALETGQVDKRGLHTVTFGLYDAGIEPDVIHTSKGLVAVLIEDISGGSKGLLVERETGSARVAIGQVLRFGQASQASWRGRSEFNLEPGTYRVTDTSRPQNTAHLIVEP